VEKALFTLRTANDSVLQHFPAFVTNGTGGLAGLHVKSLPGFASKTPDALIGLTKHLSSTAQDQLRDQIREWVPRDAVGNSAQVRNEKGNVQSPGLVLGVLRSLDRIVKAHNEWASSNEPTKIIPADFSHTKEGVENALSILRSFNAPL